MLEVLGLAFIGLLSVASFSVLAQRRLRALGMLSAIGATERNLRLVMIVNGLVVGVAGALAGAALGLAAWFAYAPTLQRATGHVVDPASLPWWAIGIGAVFAIVTSVLASRNPAKTMAAVPVVAALSGRPAPPKAVHRSAVPGVIAFAVGLAFLAFAGGQAGPPGGGRGPGGALPLLVGLVGVIVGIFLLAPLGISVLTAGAGPRLPVAIRIAVRDLVRYRARSGAALAAVTFAMFLAMVICLVGSERTANPLMPVRPQPVQQPARRHRGAQPVPRHDDAALRRPGGQPGQATQQPRRQPARAVRAGAGIRGHTEPGRRAAQPQQPNSNSIGVGLYVATPQLLAMYGIKASQIAPGTDVLTARPGLAGLSHMEMIWQSSGNGGESDSNNNGPSCTPGSCLASPAIQTVSSLPSGTDAPEHADHRVRGAQVPHADSAVRVADPGTGPAHRHADPSRATRHSRLPGAARDRLRRPGLRRDRRRRHSARHHYRARRAGRVRRPDPQRDRAGPAHAHRDRGQHHHAADDHRGDRGRAGPAWRAPRHGLRPGRQPWSGRTPACPPCSATCQLADVLILLVGLPLVAAAGGWLLAGREPEVIARQPLD